MKTQIVHNPGWYRFVDIITYHEYFSLHKELNYPTLKSHLIIDLVAVRIYR